jgi:hypothetical protein
VIDGAALEAMVDAEAALLPLFVSAVEEPIVAMSTTTALLGTAQLKAATSVMTSLAPGASELKATVVAPPAVLQTPPPVA